MIRRTTAVKAAVVAGAVAASAFALTPANAAGVTLTSFAVHKAAVTGTSVVGAKGTGLTDAITVVGLAGGGTTCYTDKVQVVSSTQLYFKLPGSGCSAGFQTVSLYSGTTGTPGAPVGTGFTATSKNRGQGLDLEDPPAFSQLDDAVGGTTGITVTGGVAATATVGGAPYASAPITGGTAATATVTLGALPSTATVQVKVGTHPVAGKLSSDHGHVLFKTPAAEQPGPADVTVVVNGFPAVTAPGALVYKEAITVSPNIYSLSAAAPPLVRITGRGFTPTATSKQYVSVCGVAATLATTPAGKAPKATSLYATLPTFSAAAAGSTDGKVTTTSGGVCIVKVIIDPKGDDTLTNGLPTADPSSDDFTSVVTGSAGVVYTSY